MALIPSSIPRRHIVQMTILTGFNLGRFHVLDLKAGPLTNNPT